VDDPESYLRAADLFVLPSEREGMPNALLEAMACGLPAIAFEIPGTREVAGPERAVELLAAGDRDALTSAIVRLLERPAERAALAQRGLARIRERFLLDQRIETYLALYRRLSDGTGSRRVL
jgi:glycosyltransferase involved in cell wall biosynthesis